MQNDRIAALTSEGAGTSITFDWRRNVVVPVVVAVAYAAAGRLGLALDAVSGFAALVWPPSGIALAALLLGGYRLWPAILVAAFATNYWEGAPLLTSTGIAAGNTLAAIAGAFLITRLPGFRTSLERVRDVVALVVLAAIGSSLIAATAGVSVLSLSDIVAPGRFAETWRAWWVGDAIGDIVVAPLILVWASRRPRVVNLARMAEAMGLGAVVIVATAMIFSVSSSGGEAIVRREYMLFPLLVWAALRFGVRGAVTTSATAMVVAVALTVSGSGPFIDPDPSRSLLALQIFMGISGATFLLLGAAITERKRSAEDLVVARETAESANKAKAGFLAAVSHELRTPLNAITGYVDLLSLELDGPLTEKQRGILSRISHSQRHLLLLIEDVLGFAQVEAGKLSFDLQPVVVADALASIEPIVGAELLRKGLGLEVATCDPGLVVHADPDKLRQILLNLVTNAIKFTDPPGAIVISAQEDGANVRLSVSDTGIGIPEPDIARVFNPFFQVHQGPTRRYGGLGLGLSIVRDIAEGMNGDVEIESTVGKGTVVSVILPRLEIAAPALAS